MQKLPTSTNICPFCNENPLKEYSAKNKNRYGRDRPERCRRCNIRFYVASYRRRRNAKKNKRNSTPSYCKDDLKLKKLVKTYNKLNKNKFA